MADLGDMIAKLLLDSSQWVSGMKDVESTTTHAAEQAEGAFSGIGESVGKIGEALAGLALAEGLREFAADAIKASDEIGRFRTAMVNMKGDTQNVEDFLTKIHELAATSPFAFPELAESAKRMVLLGQSLQQTQETMQAIVETGTALKLTASQVTGIADAMSKLGQGAEPMRVMKTLVSESIPAWQMLADQMGVSIPKAQEAVKKGIIGSQEVFQLLTTAMEGNADAAAKWGDTWRGAMKQLSTETELAMAAVGDDIKTALNDIAAPVLKEAAKLVGELADWWKELPAPVKDAVLAFGASVAVIGAVGGALTLLGTVLGALGAEFLAPVAAIGVLVAALVGLGAWVSEHWGPLTDILTHAWDEIEKIWGVTWNEIKAALSLIWDDIVAVGKTVFNAYATLYSTIWDVVKTIWAGVWAAIKVVLVTAWEEIRAALKIFDAIATYFLAFWEPIKQKFQEAWTFISSNLTSVWSKLASTFGVVQKAAADVTAEMSKSVEVNKEAKKVVDDHANSMTGLSKATKEVTDKFIAMRDKTAILWAEMAILNAAHQKLLQTVAANNLEEARMAAAHQTLIDKFMAFLPPLADTAKGLDALVTAGDKAVKTFGAVGGSVVVADNALKSLGITSTRAAQTTADHTAEMVKQVDAAGDMESSYDRLMARQADLNAQIQLLIRTDGEHAAKLQELRDALKETTAAIDAMTTTTTDAYHKMGLSTAEDIDKIMAKDKERWDTALQLSQDGNPALVRQAKEAELQMLKDQDEMYGNLSLQQAKRMEQLKTELGKHHNDQLEAWKAFDSAVKKDFESTFDALEKKLITGDGSFSEIMTNLWQSLAKDALDLFLKPIKKAIEEFIVNTLGALLGDGGFGGVLDSLKKIGSAVSDVFTGAGKAAGGAAGAAGGAAGDAGSAGAAVGSGLAGIVGAVGSVVSAISGIISNFQMAKQETTLNAIEHNTRFTMMYVGERADGGILGILFKIDEEIAFGYNTKATEQLKDLFKDWSGMVGPVIVGIQNQLVDMMPYVVDIKVVLEDIRDLIGDLSSSVRTGLDTLNVTVTATGVTTVEAAKALGNQIAANLSRQLVQTS